VALHTEVDTNDAKADAANTHRQLVLGDGSVEIQLLRDEGGSGWFLSGLRVCVPACEAEVMDQCVYSSYCPALRGLGFRVQRARLR